MPFLSIFAYFGRLEIGKLLRLLSIRMAIKPQTQRV